MMIRKYVFSFLLGITLLTLTPTIFAEEPMPIASELLAKSDAYRIFNGKSFTFDVKLTSQEPGEEDKVFVLNAEILNPHTSLILYAEPTSERGKVLLMDQKNLWFHSPTSSKPIRITPQQRLLGEVSNGDVASTDFSNDYDPRYVKQETLDGADYHVLELNAKADSLATYHKLNLWLRVDNNRPFKAEFYAVSGKLLKTAYYTRFEKLPTYSDKEQLMALEISDPMTAGKKTLMEYSNFAIKELPASRFNSLMLDKVR